MRADQARSLLTQAKQDQTYEGPVPEDDAKAIEEANAVIDLATDAWEDQVRGPEVETILPLTAEGVLLSEARAIYRCTSCGTTPLVVVYRCSRCGGATCRPCASIADGELACRACTQRPWWASLRPNRSWGNSAAC